MRDIRPKIVGATLDGEHQVTVRFSRRYEVGDWRPGKFVLTTSVGQRLTIRGVRSVEPRQGRSAGYALEVAEPMDFTREEFTVEAQGLGPVAVRPWRVLHDATRFYDAQARLGTTYSAQQTTFAVFAPSAKGVEVVVAEVVEGDAGLTVHEMTRNDKGVWQTTVQSDLEGKYYAYRLSGPGFDPKAEVTDVYATCTQGRHARSLIVDLPKTDPPGFRDYRPGGPAAPADAVVYEMHVRDFTIAGNSGVRQKGRYLGLTEGGTHLPDDSSVVTGIDHLVELGATHVQLMPVQDFDNAEERQDEYNWGYMPVQFNSPDGWYASSMSGPARIREFKQAVKAFHDRGMGVIMDVVYSHTAGAASFEQLVPGYYFRMTAAGRFCNGSGCGNEFHSQGPMARKFMLDSAAFWVREYLIDGFRFDLMSLIDLETMQQIKAELEQIRPGILIYGEPWAAGPTPLKPITDHRHIRGTGMGAFNDHFRDAIKGDRDGGPPGFIQVGDRAEGIRQGLQGAIHDWARDPVDSINYFEAHDNLTAWDKLLQSVPNESDATRQRMMRFAALILLTSQGVAFLHSGQEFCRTKRGNHNSYDAPDEINQIDWSLKRAHAEVYAYHRGLIALRKAHPVLRLGTRAEVEQRVRFEKPPDERCIIYALDGRGLAGEPAERVLVLLNGKSKAVTFMLPKGLWLVHADADRASLEPLGTAQGKITLPGHCGMLLCRAEAPA